MKFEDLENTWSSQAAPVALDFAALQRASGSEMRRRTRFLRYELGGVLFALIGYPLLSLGNYNYFRPANAWLFWVNVALHIAVWLPLLVYTLRRLRRHRALLRDSVASVRNFSVASLAATVAEMRDNRLALAFVPLAFGMALLSSYANQQADYTLRTFAIQTGALAAILLPVIAVTWRHHRRYLAPRRERLQVLLGELQ